MKNFAFGVGEWAGDQDLIIVWGILYKDRKAWCRVGNDLAGSEVACWGRNGYNSRSVLPTRITQSIALQSFSPIGLALTM